MAFLTQRCIPNLITLLRFLLILPVFLCLLYQYEGFALILIIIAGVSDMCDGLLARRYGWESRFGSIADPLADKLLLNVSFIGLAWAETIPFLLMWVVLARDAIIVGGALAYHYFIGLYEFKPTFISKINTALQIMMVIMVLFDQSVINLPSIFIKLIIYFVLATSIISGAHYMYIWSKRAYGT